MYWRKAGAVAVASSALTIGAQSSATAAGAARPQTATTASHIAAVNPQYRCIMISFVDGGSGTDGDGVEILGLDARRSIRRPIVAPVEILEIAPQLRLRGFRERGKGALCRPEMGAEELNGLGFGERVVQRRHDGSRLQVRHAVAKPLAQLCFIAPRERRRRTGPRRQVLLDDLMLPADEAARRPIGHGDPSAGFAHADQLGR